MLKQVSGHTASAGSNLSGSNRAGILASPREQGVKGTAGHVRVCLLHGAQRLPSPPRWEKSEKTEESISNPREDHRRLHRDQEGMRPPAKEADVTLGWTQCGLCFSSFTTDNEEERQEAQATQCPVTLGQSSVYGGAT